jgi:hypothetical protein
VRDADHVANDIFEPVVENGDKGFG